MSRLTAWVVLLAAAGLIYTLVFTTYDQFSGTWETTESGGLVEIAVVCPPPFQVLVFGEEPDGVDEANFCAPSSRTLALEAGVVVLAAGLIVWNPITRRRPQSIGPISDKIDLTLNETD